MHLSNYILPEGESENKLSVHICLGKMAERTKPQSSNYLDKEQGEGRSKTINCGHVMFSLVTLALHLTTEGEVMS